MRRGSEERDGDDEAEDGHEDEPVHLGVRVGREGQEDAIEIPKALSDRARDRLENALVAVRQKLPRLCAERDPGSAEPRRGDR